MGRAVLAAEHCVTEESPRGISAWEAIVGTAIRPDETFGRLVKAPTWWLPALLWLAVVFASTWVVTPKIDFDRSLRDILEKRGVSEERMEKIIARADRAPLSNAMKGTAGLAVVFALVALVFWGAARAFGSSARFTQVLAVWGHANLANVAGGLFTIALLAQLPEASITQQQLGHYVKSSVGAFLPESVGPFLLSLASSIDLFTLGALVLLCVGLRRLPELGSGSATGIPLVLWGLYALGKASLAAILF